MTNPTKEDSPSQLKFKYQIEIDGFAPDLSNFKERENRPAFIWVFDPLDHVKNFLPKYVRNENAIKEAFTGWCLSVFDTHENAKQRLLHITKNKEHLFKRLGTHISEGSFDKADGMSDDPNGIGHFSHIEYEGVNLSSKFQIKTKIA